MKTKNHHKTRGKTVDSQKRTVFYMSQLDSNLKRKLYELYEPDFKLFGYDHGHTI